MSRVEELDDIDPADLETRRVTARPVTEPASTDPAPADPAPTEAAPTAAAAEAGPPQVAPTAAETGPTQAAPTAAETPPTQAAPTQAVPTQAVAEGVPTEGMSSDTMSAPRTPPTAEPPAVTTPAFATPAVTTPAVTTPAVAPPAADSFDTTPIAVDDLTQPGGPGDTDSSYLAAEQLDDARRRARRGTLDVGLLLLRCAVGLIALAHGTQKLFGWWDGPRLSGFEDFLINAPSPAIGFDPDAARVLAILGALSETLGGLMLVLGLFTPIAASAVLGVMLVASAYKATLAGGVWFFAADHGGGIEYEGLLAVCAVVIILTGPGLISLDAPRGWARRPAWGSAALVIVAIGAAVAVWVAFNGTNPFTSPGNPTT
ncbi:hypothetical protein GORHZ_235_00120 [Gordonia rhizosphera NBRC 16068]|uniref:DoxX family protein n=2 Tax=Gordonia rhizosphera TaxID=83341 RepID=K6VBS0_9ACTN|nr:hypothetical protein GORHZ_235_00120 [Gordonia rhizosphera NBRC 16068]